MVNILEVRKPLKRFGILVKALKPCLPCVDTMLQKNHTPASQGETVRCRGKETRNKQGEAHRMAELHFMLSEVQLCKPGPQHEAESCVLSPLPVYLRKLNPFLFLKWFLNGEPSFLLIFNFVWQNPGTFFMADKSSTAELCPYTQELSALKKCVLV